MGELGLYPQTATSRVLLMCMTSYKIQTKFSRPSAQDPETAPYDMHASIEEQVHASIKTSLHNLRHKADLDASSDESVYLDSLVLHSPFLDFKDTLTAWLAMST